MPPGEIPVTCPGCSYQLRVPFAAVRRNNMYCPQCGKNIPLAGVQAEASSPDPAKSRAKPKRSSRPMRRR